MTTNHSSHDATDPYDETPADALRRAIEHLAHLLPDQGPIDVFIHHNTLHAFQHLHFHEALAAASEQFGTEPYLSEKRYRELLAEGRITVADLRAALAENPRPDGPSELGPLDADALDLLLLEHEVTDEPASRWRWLVDERGALRKFRPDVKREVRARFLARSTEHLSRLCERAKTLADVEAQLRGSLHASLEERDLASLRRSLRAVPEAVAIGALWAACQPVAGEARPPRRRPRHSFYRDLIKDATAEDPAELAHPLIIRYVAAYLDEGVADWAMPERSKGLFHAWRMLALSPFAPEPPWLAGLEDFLRARETPERVILDVLGELRVPRSEWQRFLTQVALELPGWAGMIHRLERRPADRRPGAPPASLLDFLAMRLVYDVFAWRDVARRRLLFVGSLDGLERHIAQVPFAAHDAGAPHDSPWRLFQIAQAAGLTAGDVVAMTPAERAAVLARADAFTGLMRRRIFHEAYERRYRQRVLRGIADNLKRPEAERSVAAASLQLVVCFDDREEAFRRHIEACEPAAETYGNAGFFGVPMDYRGLDDRDEAPLCPVIVTPANRVEERPLPDQVEVAATRRSRLKGLARFLHRFDESSRSLVRGSLITPLFGLVTAIPWALKTFAPRLEARLRIGSGRLALPAPRTTQTALRADGAPSADGKPLGFTVSEAVSRVGNSLENIGLTRRFARLVVILGHGGTSVNNPHRSAYDCGACGGRHGGPNARILARLANEPTVREGLRARGIDVPESTRFIGGEHDTTTDGVALYDLDAVPESHRGDLARATETLEHARRMSAHERCRKFESAPRDPSPERALRHVEGRAADVSQARPELGHVTVAAGVVGRRAITRGLFLDRRAFVISYDPAVDPEGKVLERILQAAGPVGAGINLEYLFSCTDNDRYGAGTKLPHNPVGLFGVMDGALSDLRTGLPRQMIEIHEPVRLLLVVEATPERLLAIAERQAEVKELVVNEWVQLVSLDPETGAMRRFTARGFEAWDGGDEPATPRTPDWRSWYRGKIDFLPPAIVGGAT